MSERRAACFGRDPERDGWPTVSVVVPLRNEGTHLARAVDSILAQEYPIPFDVCLAVAPSDDDTAEVAVGLASTDNRITVVENPAGATPAGLNAAIRATNGSIVVRVDGHSELSDGYVCRAVETMCRTGAVNVGAMQVPRPQTPLEEAVAAATTSWLGTGGAAYRVGGTEGPVDTAYLGVFDRGAGDAVGWFDEALIRNQDYELNIRLRDAGGIVWFDPALRVGYRPRGTWEALARQYFEYGSWKAEVALRHPTAIRPRQMIAGLAPIVVAASAVAGARRPRAAIPAAVYVSAISMGALRVTRSARSALRVVGVLAVQHGTWSAGFLTGVCKSVRRRAGS